MPTIFPYKKGSSSALNSISRPYIPVSFWSARINDWVEIELILDSGADYTLLPRFYAEKLGVILSRDTTKLITNGVGGAVRVFFCKQRLKIKLGQWERNIPAGFLDNNEVPALFGRYNSMDTFKITLYKQVVEIDSV